MTGTAPFGSLLAPARIAVIGSISRPDRMGARTVRHLERARFAGVVEAVSDVADLGPGHIGVAVLAVPAAAVGAVLEALDGRADHAVVYSSGFGEAGAPSLAGVTTSTRVLGPNTVGVYWAPSRAVISFAQAFDDMTSCEVGRGVVVVSQSGAFGARLVRAARHRGLVVDGFLATGNEDGYTAAGIVEELAALDGSRPRVVVLYLENVGDGAALRRALRQASAEGVQVVVLFGGRGRVGADAARSHTAAVSPDHRVLAEVLRLHGVVVVRTDREAVDAALALSVSDRAGGNRFAVVTGSGGAGVVAADLLEDACVQVAPIGPVAKAELAALLPTFATVSNPIDVTAQVITDTDRVGEAVEVLACSGDVDGVLVVARGPQAAALTRRGADAGVPTVVGLLDGDDATIAELVSSGVLALGDLGAAVNACAALAIDPMPLSDRVVERCPPALARAARRSAGPDDVVSSLLAVERAGVTTARWRVATTLDEAVAAFDALGPPVVMKANVPAGVHKAAAGAIRLDLVDAAAVLAAFEELQLLADQVVVAAQRRGGPELFAGVRLDGVFGRVVVLGLGGSAMELVDRTITVPADASTAWVEERLLRMVLASDARRAGLASPLARCGARLAAFAGAQGAALVECNPLIPDGDDLVALDARVVRNEAP